MLFVPRRPELTRYDEVSQASASLVIRAYSSSFGMASRLLAEPVRTRVCNIYALVRVADEIVDNPDRQVGRDARARMLDGLEEEVRHGLESGHSANLVVHAFVRTAAECGIGDELVAPFFESMRTDLDTTTHTRDSFERYVYGSAEVVGLMCLRVFLADEPGRHAALRRARRRRQAAGGGVPEGQLPARPRRGPRPARPLLLPRPRRRVVLRRRPRPAPRRRRRGPRRRRRRAAAPAPQQPACGAGGARAPSPSCRPGSGPRPRRRSAGAGSACPRPRRPGSWPGRSCGDGP